MEIFLHNPLQSLTFALIIFAIASLWIHKNPYLWGSLFGTSYFLGMISGVVLLKSVFSIVILFCAYLFLNTEKPKGWLRLLPVLIITLFSFGLIFHRVPGFVNWPILRNIALSAKSYPYTLFWNYDKALLGLFPLALFIPLFKTKSNWKKVIPKTLLISLFTFIILLGLSYFFNFIAWDPKLPRFLPSWIIANLFFVSIAEEAFFRGFLQKELTDAIPSRHSAWFAILFVSLLFALAHIFFIQDPRYLVLTFVASFLYGTIFHLTKAIESSIFSHFLVNLIHLLLFTYPTMK